MGQFALALEAFAKKASKRADQAVAKIVIDCGTSLVVKSPVGDANYWKEKPPKGYTGGLFRGSWRYGIDKPSDDHSETVDANGSVTITAIVGAIDIDSAAKRNHYITNPRPYGQRLEEGYSRQAPQGMVNLTVMEFEGIVAAAAAAVK